MKQCGTCLKIYDESEYACCPYCEGLLYDDDDDFEDDEIEMYDKDED